MYWEITQAEQSFPELLYAANEEPQLIYRQNQMVAAVVQGEIFTKFLDWYKNREPIHVEPQPQRSVGQAFEELRQLCVEEDYTLEIPPRQDRPNAFLEVLDELDDYHELSM